MALETDWDLEDPRANLRLALWSPCPVWPVTVSRPHPPHGVAGGARGGEGSLEEGGVKRIRLWLKQRKVVPPPSSRWFCCPDFLSRSGAGRAPSVLQGIVGEGEK